MRHRSAVSDGRLRPCRRLVFGVAAPVLAAVLSLSAGTAQPVAPPASPRPPTPKQRRQIEQMQEHLRQTVREQDEELERLLSELHGAPRDKKIDLLTRIVTRLIEQRKAYHQEAESIRLRILDMQNPPAPLPRTDVSPLPAPAAAEPSSGSPSEAAPPVGGQGYVPQQEPQ